MSASRDHLASPSSDSHRPPRKRRARARRARESDDEVERQLSSDDEGSQASLSSSASSSTSKSSEQPLYNHNSPIVSIDPPIHSTNPSTTDSSLIPQHEPVTSLSTSGAFLWSDSIMDTTATSSEQDTLPVLDFQEFSSGVTQETSPEEVAVIASLPISPSSVSKPRQSARQVYQQRLTNDPSFVPVVGDFWGHDDRLMDKSLRSLSGWWRGRWMGRGAGGPMRGRRVNGGQSTRSDGLKPGFPVGRNEASSTPTPSDNAWVHDGFEQMELRDKQRSNRVRNRAQDNVNGSGTPSMPSTEPESSQMAKKKQKSFDRVPTSPNNQFLHRASKPDSISSKTNDSTLFDDASTQTLSSEVRVRLPHDSKSTLVIPLLRQGTTAQSQENHRTRPFEFRPLVVKLPKLGAIQNPRASRVLTPEPITTIDESHLNKLSELQLPHHQPSFPMDSTLVRSLDRGRTEPHLSENRLLHSAPEGVQLPEEMVSRDPNSFQTNLIYNGGYGYPSGQAGRTVYDLGYPSEGVIAHPAFLQGATAPEYANHTLAPPHPPMHSDMMVYGSVPPEYFPPQRYFGDNLQFSLPRQSSRIEIRAPKENRSADSTQHEGNAINQQTGHGVEAFLPIRHGYATNLAVGDVHGAGQDGLMHPLMYQGVHYYNNYIPAYGFSQYPEPGRPYEGYSNEGYY